MVLSNLTSSWREFQALHDIARNIPLLPEILATEKEPLTMNIKQEHTDDGNTTPQYTPDDDEEENATATTATTTTVQVTKEEVKTAARAMRQQRGISEKYFKFLKTRFNPSQLLAISKATISQGFTLIQGPPGTGKTSTIIGILNSIHIREYHRYYEDLLQAALSAAGRLARSKYDTSSWMEIISKVNERKPRVLVVAPSNIAVDNIIERIINQGFKDGSGCTYHPNIVRVGTGKTENCRGVSLDELVQAALFTHLTENQKVTRRNELERERQQVLDAIIQHQGALLALKEAFSLCKPLPRHWELRVTLPPSGVSLLPLNHYQAYWVDHKHRRTQSMPPALCQIAVEDRDATGGIISHYTRAEVLPEFLFHSHALTQALESLEKIRQEIGRLDLSLTSNNSSSSSNSGRGNHAFNHAPSASMKREMLETAIISHAQILFTTLNSCGMPAMESTEFCVTVVDEAAQCVEPSILIALRRGCRQCILVSSQYL